MRFFLVGFDTRKGALPMGTAQRPVDRPPILGNPDRVCNLYDVGPTANREKVAWEKRVREAVGDRTVVAPGKPGLLIRLQEGEPVASEGRWGVARPWSPCINNSRDDKLGSAAWRDHWKNRRCVIPMRRFYEWTGPRGNKTRHAVTPDPDGWSYAAGLWEEDAALGLCYSMVTTAANSEMAEIHHRMPALLEPAKVSEFLEAEDATSCVRPWESVLRIDPPPQRDLFD